MVERHGALEVDDGLLQFVDIDSDSSCSQPSVNARNASRLSVSRAPIARPSVCWILSPISEASWTTMRS